MGAVGSIGEDTVDEPSELGGAGGPLCAYCVRGAARVLIATRDSEE